jgi:hypothetical protein
VGSRVGGIAQLGEHLLCKQGVIGSIPIVSTTAIPSEWRMPPQSSHGGNRLLANDESRSVWDGCCAEEAGCFWSVSRMSRIRFDHVAQAKRPGFAVMPFVLPGWAALFFITVNQVLVRLWARVIKTGPFGLVAIPSFGRIV